MGNITRGLSGGGQMYQNEQLFYVLLGVMNDMAMIKAAYDGHTHTTTGATYVQNAVTSAAPATGALSTTVDPER